MENLYIGTCSWKYPSWKGLVYTKKKPLNYLEEYAEKYNCVEVDQWFWSLFGDSVVLPKSDIVQEYALSVPNNFRFGVKVPNAVTLTHHYSKASKASLIPNQYFLSAELMNRFLDSLGPIHSKLGPIILQFEYLNKQKMSGQGEFINKLGKFIDKLPKEFSYCIEARNPNYLNDTYFNALAGSNLTHVFLEGYFMPSIMRIFEKHKDLLLGNIVVRLHGSDRHDIEKQTNKNWHEIVAPKDEEIKQLASILSTVSKYKYVYVNNHFEGSAPKTIEKIINTLS